MRKLSYVLTFFITVVILVLNILSAQQPDWLVVEDKSNTTETVRYGLLERCERRVLQDGRLRYVDYKCRSFPMRLAEQCEGKNRAFCVTWVSAWYATEMGIFFSGLALFALLIGMSTHSRRRRIWRAVAALIGLHAAFQLVAFALITDIYHRGAFEPFQNARLSAGYYMNLVSWIIGVLMAAGVTVTGISADKGHSWAAGNRAYRPIRG